MNIRNRIEKFKNNMKTAGMVAVFGTMTLNSSAQKVTQDKKEHKIEVVNKSFNDSKYYYEAIENNDLKNVKKLIADGKDFHACETIKCDDGTYTYPSAIFMAVEYENLEITEALLNAGANPNHKYGNKPLVFWAESVEMFQLLEKYGADLNAKDDDGKQPLYNWSGPEDESFLWDAKIAEFLLQKGNSQENLKYFYPTNVERTKFCVEKGIDFDMRYAVGTAVNIGTYEDLKILLKNGGAKYINVGNEGEEYSSPFETAILDMVGDEEGMIWEKENGKPPYRKSSEECWNERKQKAELMISYGADFSNIPEILKLGEGVEAHPETNKFVKQAEAKQAQLNKMKQNQGR